MNYEKYIKLGFKRTELNCSVEKSVTGYGGFALAKQLNEQISIEVVSGELDSPRMYIKKLNSDTYHIIPIPCDAVEDLFDKPIEKYDFTNIA